MDSLNIIIVFHYLHWTYHSSSSVGNLNDLLQTDVEDDTELAQRVDVPGEETFCDYDSRMEYPTKALSRDEKWLTVVNHSNYTQGIRMEICR